MVLSLCARSSLNYRMMRSDPLWRGHSPRDTTSFGRQRELQGFLARDDRGLADQANQVDSVITGGETLRGRLEVDDD